MHSNVTIKNVSWPHFSRATLYNTWGAMKSLFLWSLLRRHVVGMESNVVLEGFIQLVNRRRMFLGYFFSSKHPKVGLVELE